MSESTGSLGILVLEGEIDLYRSAEVREKLAGLIDRKMGRILVDMSRVNYIDSSGLALFIECLQRMAEYGGRLGIFGLQQTVAHIFEIARLDQVLHIYPDETAARVAV